MAKSLLLNILVDILGNYVEDLTKDNLKLAVWSGTIELYNLKLKSTALDKLNLPVKILRGSLKKLQLKIPWTNLESKPVSVIMDGMYLETGPVDLSEISTADAKRLVAKSRQKKMEKAERAIMAIIHNKAYKRKKKASYIKQLTAKIMDNLEISITNLHFRYEDQDSIPGSIISCGVTIESISLQTTDDKWNPAYIVRDGEKDQKEDAVQKKKASAIHKLGAITNLAIYWNSAHSSELKSVKKVRSYSVLPVVTPPTTTLPGTTGVGFLSFENTPVATTEEEQARLRWEAKMQSLIYTEASESADTHAAEAGILTDNDPERESLDTMKYLLRPPNKITVKMVHRELCTETQPNIDLTITCTALQSKLVDDQYRQLRTLSKVLKGLDRRKLMLYHRPNKRPGADPKAWWHYAYFLATGNYPIRRAKMEVMADCVLAKRHLVPYWRRNLVNKEVIADQEFLLPADFLESELGADVKALELEDKLPISALIALRQYAAQEAVLEITTLRTTPKEMKRYIDAHHLDPNREGADNSKNKFWGLGKMAKLGKNKNELTELEGELLRQKKKKGIMGMFKLGKKKDKSNVVSDSMHGSVYSGHGYSEPNTPGGIDASSTHGMKLHNPNTTTSTMRGVGSSGTISGMSSPDTHMRRVRKALDSDGTDGDSDLEDEALHDEDSDPEHPHLDQEHDHDHETEENADITLEDDAKLLEELQAALIKTSLDADQAFTQRVKLACSVSLKVNFAAQTIVVVSMNLRVCQEKRRGLQRFIVEVDSLSIRDSVSVKPIFKYIVSSDKAQLNTKILRRASIIQTNGSVVIPPIEFARGDKIDTSEVQFNLLFEKKKGDSVEKGNSALFIKTAPLQVVWNELCIRQLLLCFASKSSASDMDLFIQSAAERNKMLSQGIKKFKAELSAPSYKVTTIAMEIYAPSILIPEQYDSDCGCMRLDIGKMLIEGRKSYAGMSLKVQLLSINIGIPTKISHVAQTFSTDHSESGKGRSRAGTSTNNITNTTTTDTTTNTTTNTTTIPTTNTTNPHDSTSTNTTLPHLHTRMKSESIDDTDRYDSTYLIKPFDVNISVDKYTHNKVGDLVLNVAVSPRIDAQLDALKLIRFKYMLDVVIKSLKKKKDPNADPAAKAEKKKKKKKKAEGEEEEVNYERQKMYFQFTLPSAVVKLCLSPEHTVDFTITTIRTTVISRAGDLRMVTGLDSFTLNDSMRPRKHRQIIWTDDASHTTHTTHTTHSYNTHASDGGSNSSHAHRHSNVVSGTSTTTSGIGIGNNDIRHLFGVVHDSSDDEAESPKKPAEHAIVFALTRINTIQSPLFDGIQQDASVTFGTIHTNIDDHAVLRFGPFISELINTVKVYKEKADEHNKAVDDFMCNMDAMAHSDFSSNRYSTKYTTNTDGVMMSPGANPNITVRNNIGGRSNTSSARITNPTTNTSTSGSGKRTSTTPKTPKIGYSRLTFSARALSLDILQELVTAEPAATVIDSSKAFQGMDFSEHNSGSNTSFHGVNSPFSLIERGSDVGSSDAHDVYHTERRLSEDFALESAQSSGSDTDSDGEDQGFESAFRLTFDNIYFEMSSKEEEKRVDAHMTMFSLVDVRASSQKFVFNTLLSRSDKQQASQTDAASSKRKSTSSAVEHILHFTYIQKTKNFVDIELVFHDITSYVSVDITLAFVALIRDNYKAYKAVKKIVKDNKKKAEPTLRAKLAMEAYQRSKRKGSTAEAPVISEKKVIRNFAVIVNNPRLFVLEDPENANTKAIVSDCKINLYVVRETHTTVYVDHERSESKDNIHLSLRDFQLFVWTNIQQQSMPHQIIEPAGMDIHIINNTENDITLIKQFKCSTDTLRCRVSLNDIVLTSSILARAKLIKSKKKGVKKVKKVKKQKVKKQRSSINGSPSVPSESSQLFLALTMYKIDLNIGSISVVLLNDFNNLNVPMFKAVLDQSDFNAEGSKMHMEGSGSITFSADNYNVRATCWEPIIEPFQPTLLFNKDFNGTRFTLQSTQTLQLNLTGIMVNCYSRAKSLVAKIGKEGAYGTQRAIYPLIVRNLLGVPIELYDSRTKESILRLVDDTLHPVPSKKSTTSINSGNDSEQLRSETYADLFDIHLLGGERDLRQPILHAPLTAGRAKRYIFRPNERQLFHTEPVLEEVYENQRYNIIKRAWVDPWLHFDPVKWTDSRGNASVDPAHFPLPDLWRWLDGEWIVDVGKVGTETDEHGWEYQNNFDQFTPHRYRRRSSQPLDVVRRRRLLRTRIPVVPYTPQPIASASSDFMSPDNTSTGSGSGGRDKLLRPRSHSNNTTTTNTKTKLRRGSSIGSDDDPVPMPMVVFWEVVTKGDESREIIISSGLHVKNDGPCAIEIEMFTPPYEVGGLGSEYGSGGSGGYGGVGYGTSTSSYNSTEYTSYAPQGSPTTSPNTTNTNTSTSILRIEEGATLGIPMHLANHEYIRFRPASSRRTSYEWSDRISRIIRTERHDSVQIKRVHCRRTKHANEGFYFTVQLAEQEKQLIITCSASAVLYNGLPCPASITCTNPQPEECDGGELSYDWPAEDNKPSEACYLLPGAKAKVPRLDMSQRVDVVVEIGEYRSVVPLVLSGFEGWKEQEFVVWLANTSVDSSGGGSVGDSVCDSGEGGSGGSVTQALLQEGEGSEVSGEGGDDSTNTLPNTVSTNTTNAPATINNTTSNVSNATNATNASIHSAGMGSSTSSNAPQFSVTVRVDRTAYGVLNVFVYSQYLLVDQSDSDMVVRTNFLDSRKAEPVSIRGKHTSTQNTTNLSTRSSADKAPTTATNTTNTAYNTNNTANNTNNTTSPTTSKSPYPNPSTNANTNTKSAPASPYRIVDRTTFTPGRARSSTIAEQLQSQQGDILECWAKGIAGVAMFQAGSDQKLSLGVNRGNGWFNDIPLASLGQSKLPIEILDVHTNNYRNVALTMTPLTSALGSTSVLRVFPCYTIVNCMDEGIELLHPTDDTGDGTFYVEGKGTRPWHRPAHHSDTVLRIRSDSSGASYGTVDINEIGTTMLVLPRSSTDPSYRGEDLIIAHVEVKFSVHAFPSYISVVIWRSLMRFDVDMEIQASSTAYLSVRNETEFPFTIQQHGVLECFSKAADPTALHKFDLNILPGQWLPYGWTDPKLGSSILASLGLIVHGTQTLTPTNAASNAVNAVNSAVTKVRRGTSHSSANPSCIVDTRHVNQITVLDLSAFHGEASVNISFVMKTLGNGLVLCIYKSNELLGTGAKMYFKNPLDSTENTDNSVVTSSNKEADEMRKHTVFSMKLSGISMSLLAEIPYRRELLGVYVDNFETKFRKSPESAKEGAMTSVEVRIKDIQVDNYSETIVYPVLCTSSYSGERSNDTRNRRRIGKTSSNNDLTTSGKPKVSTILPSGEQVSVHIQQQSLLQAAVRNTTEEDEYPPFLQFSVVKENPKGRGKVDAIIKYVGLRILELNIAVDSSSIVMFYIDLLKGMSKESTHTIERHEEAALRMYYTEFNAQVATWVMKESGLNALDTDKVLKKAQVKKYFFETMVIHPLKLTLTFTPTSLSRFETDGVFKTYKKLKLLQAGQGVPEIEKFEIKLNSFMVTQAMESVKTMRKRVLKNVKRELKSNLLLIGGNLIGSMNIIGKPAGLLKNVGDGVQAFFYEPYLGVLEGPTGLARGIRKGTGALVTGVASGIVGYTASVVGTASSGVSLVAQGIVSMSNGQEQDVYLQDRENKRRLFKASAGGVLNGFRQGGMDIVSGVASGVKGLVAKPVQEGRKSGALGVMRGMGMGVVGVVVKPVLGLSDGITSVAAGFTTQMLADSSVLAKHTRPTRALERANPMSGEVLVLLPMDLFAARAQLYLTQHNDKAEYLASCTLGYEISTEYPNAEYGLLLSTSRIYLLSATAQTLWDISFSELSHIVLKKNMNPNSVGQDQGQYGVVGFVLYGCSLAVTKTVTCPSRLQAIRLYSFLLKFAHRMGNPAANVPLEDILAEEMFSRADTNNTNNPDPRDPRDRVRKRSLGGVSLDTYIFGYANNLSLPMSMSHFASENTLLESTRDKLSHIYCDNMNDKDQVYFYHRQIDECMYQLVMNWKHSHTLKLTPSHGFVCLLLNNSPSYAPVQLVDMELIEGKDYVVWSVGDTYDHTSRTISPNGGGVVIFAYGAPAPLNDAPSVKLQIRTTAFSCTLSSTKGEPNCINHNGFIVGFLEKAMSDMWSKAVIDISLQK